MTLGEGSAGGHEMTLGGGSRSQMTLGEGSK
jgi:hypothetical protein